ncbi:hypothetical protein NE237_017330 [Protea cynaroides]|uniref:Uncharacterized protein n=1 Tax=Protea cynaroides TaxID=273540 RepID=A0A9Q0K7V7_9MAGN|nr:hypothetical protein NE237_017330 [Protea cynaroides]
MATVKFIFVCVVLLVLVFSQAVTSVKGRHLLAKTKESNDKPITPTEKTEGTVARKGGESTSALADESPAVALAHIESTEPAGPVKDSRVPAQGHIDDFRPTDPGHSPGVGH